MSRMKTVFLIINIKPNKEHSVRIVFFKYFYKIVKRLAFIFVTFCIAAIIIILFNIFTPRNIFSCGIRASTVCTVHFAGHEENIICVFNTTLTMAVSLKRVCLFKKFNTVTTVDLSFADKSGNTSSVFMNSDR